MKKHGLTRRAVLATGAAGVIAGTWLKSVRSAHAATKVRLLTNWYAESAQGGFYQALASGLYETEGLDVEIKMGGPQINGVQLLVAGETDFLMGNDFPCLVAVEKGLPIIAIAGTYQFALNGITTHPDVKAIEDLKTKKIMISATSRTAFWTWLKKKYGFTDDNAIPYTGLANFLHDENIAMAGIATGEVYEAQRAGVPANFFLLADIGFPPYGATVITTHGMIAKSKDTAARFVRASMQGWKDYMTDPTMGNKLIFKENPKENVAQTEWAIQKMRDLKLINGRDAATMGIGIMTDDRWKRNYDFMVDSELLKAGTDWKQAYTTEFVKDLKIMM